MAECVAGSSYIPIGQISDCSALSTDAVHYVFFLPGDVVSVGHAMLVRSRPTYHTDDWSKCGQLTDVVDSDASRKGDRRFPLEGSAMLLA